MIDDRKDMFARYIDSEFKAGWDGNVTEEWLRKTRNRKLTMESKVEFLLFAGTNINVTSSKYIIICRMNIHEYAMTMATCIGDLLQLKNIYIYT